MQQPVDADGANLAIRFAVVSTKDTAASISMWCGVKKKHAHVAPIKPHITVDGWQLQVSWVCVTRPLLPLCLQERLFQLSTFRVQSRHFNLIAFAVDVGLLLKVLRSASSSAQDAETLDVKLTQRNVAVPGTQETEAKPFLCFTSRVRHWQDMQRCCIGEGVGWGRQWPALPGWRIT